MGTLARQNWFAAHGGVPAANPPGFSLIELLSALAIMSLLLALAVPAFCLVRATLRLARRGRPLIHRRETDAAPRTPTARPATT